LYFTGYDFKIKKTRELEMNTPIYLISSQITMAPGPKKRGVLAKLANLGKRARNTLESVVECLSPRKKKPRLVSGKKKEVIKLELQFTLEACLLFKNA
jgi:hypothetical protein